jgi:lipopolysaccharide/colanic/teichoic acid biosynthesis glycosyltransferase
MLSPKQVGPVETDAVAVDAGLEGAVTLPRLFAGPELRLHRRSAVDDGSRPTARRIINVIVAALGLALCAPIMAFIALIIKLTSPGPVLYRQVRVGLDRRRPGTGGNYRRILDHGGRLFTIYKFRTMQWASGEDDEVWATPDDPRVTAVGSVLRKLRLDELPQLWNVLRGDMNIVGPRPEQPKIFSRIRGRIDSYPVRQRVLPGITGWAQIHQGYDQCVEDVRCKLALDLEYLQRASALEDVRIMLKTIPVMFFGEGGW